MCRLNTLFVTCSLILLTLPLASVEAQPFNRARRSTFGQEIPPFLRETPPPSTVRIAGEERAVPRFGSPLSPRFGYPNMLPVRQPGFLADYAQVMGLNNFLTHPYLENFADTPNHLPLLQGLRGPNARFNYRQTLPHLAFFCRLEINEAVRSVIPMKFRLGGVRHWQDDLLRGQ